MIVKKLNILFKNRFLLEWQYATGQWDVLKSPLEDERFNALISLTESYFNNGSILEIGCGEGLLASKIKKNYSYFLGIDISMVAVFKAAHLKNKRTEFKQANMEKFNLDRTFDIIVFNESINYPKDPISVINRYKNFLVKNGVFATSIHENARSIKIVHAIRNQFECLDSRATTNSRGTWHCDVFRL